MRDISYLHKGAKFPGVTTALDIVIAIYGSDTGRNIFARRFIDLLVPRAYVNDQHGLVFQKAAKLVETELVQKILEQKPRSYAVSMAFSHISERDLEEDRILRLIAAFADYHEGEKRMDVPFDHSDSSSPVLSIADGAR